MKIWRPEIFQGHLRKKRYFEGWYFKMVDATERYALAVIPGIALSEGSSHAFVQVLASHAATARYFSFPASAFAAQDSPFHIQVSQSTFSLGGLRLALADRADDITADVRFDNIIGWPVRPLSPGAMGWYRFVPRMECYHGVLSFDNTVSGHITINGEKIDMNGGRGYIEKDWGASMPSAWIWMQSNHFEQPGVSLFASIANIPWLGSSFTGYIVGLYLNGVVHRFATYTGARITRLLVDEARIGVTLEDKLLRLEIDATREKGADLAAPQLGQMTSKVNESLRSVLGVALTDKTTGKTLFAGNGRNAGLEFVGNITTMLAGLKTSRVS